ncbi:MAG TPA: acetyl-CoA C-acyltransferase, partial [Acidobacteriota bacterium]|nr:acetyl-CoA C-acyltransferase [Acidobacteriota bacterium]
MREVYIVGAARTAIGNFLGSLKKFNATELGGFAIKEALKRADITG